MRSRQSEIGRLLAEIALCRRCIEAPRGKPLPHEPRPVLRISSTARIAVVGQAPGTRVHASGVPFSDPSGVRLRAWMGVTEDEFYDVARIAIVPMGFCFPGLDAAGGDLPPRKECAPLWRDRVFSVLPNIEVMLLVGAYAQHWHLPADLRHARMTETVAGWRRITALAGAQQLWPLPHPSWRNNAWIARNPWFEADLIPKLRKACRSALKA